jgi:triacylglycerol lipase
VAAPAAAAPGPPLQEPTAKLQAGLHCDGDVATASKPAVLLVPGTYLTPEENYGPNFLRLLPAHGYPVCTVVYPNRGATDVQVGVEYIVHAIRRVAELTGRRVDVIGHSQGAWLPGYALRFWPDLARKVDDFVGYAGIWTYGTDFATVLCQVGCTAAFRQVAHLSKHIAALSKARFPAGPSYTAFLTLTDEAVTPEPLAATIVAPGARNYVQQDLCPGDVSEHVTMIDEAPFAALALDALANPGPADLARARSRDPLPCGLLPNVAGPDVLQQVTIPTSIVLGMAVHQTPSEPPLRCYLDPGCAKSRLAPVLRMRVSPRRDRRIPVRFAVTGSFGLPTNALHPCGGTVTLRFTRRGRTIKTRTVPVTTSSAPLGPDCTFTAKVLVTRRGARARQLMGRIDVRASYSGTTELLPTTTTTPTRIG